MAGLTLQDEAVVMTRNALLRAWQAYGVPIGFTKGGWGPDSDGLPGTVSIFLFCARCASGYTGWVGSPVTSENLAAEERLVINALASHVNCKHLEAMRYGIPKEVLDIAELELLAGGE